MEIFETIGIDVSKEWLDVCIHTTGLVNHFDNNQNGFKMLSTWITNHVKHPREFYILAFEHTGLYSFPLSVYLTENEFQFVQIPGLQIKRSLGITRGKNDKIDAKNIAEYAYQKREKLIPYQMPSETLSKLRTLLSLRERIVKQRAGYEASLNEGEQFLNNSKNKVLFQVQKQLVKTLNKQIKKIEDELDNLIKQDKQLLNMYNLITSIKSVGTQTALFTIAFTNAFTTFTEWRKFACYSGIAPFPYDSGKSIKRPAKVSHLANKKMKALLSSCASNAIIHNHEMKLYYERRIKEGKSKMSTLNIIRNKILARIFAVVQRGTPYVDIYKFATC